jgi:outer membrane lipoprotein-sorting protein
MRWWLAAIGCVVLVPAARAQDAAQKLYEAMEQKVAKAKVQKFDFTVDASEGGGLKVKGAFILATGNRLKLTFEGTEGKEVIKGMLLSDGKTMLMQAEIQGKPEMKTKPVPDKLYDIIIRWLPRGGLFPAMENVDRTNPKDAGTIKLSDFKSAGQEKVDGQGANVITYTLTPPDGKEPVTCKLWLDAKTNLPLKRTLDDGKGKFRVDETYRGWELEPKLPEGTFTLPK